MPVVVGVDIVQRLLYSYSESSYPCRQLQPAVAGFPQSTTYHSFRAQRPLKKITRQLHSPAEANTSSAFPAIPSCTPEDLVYGCRLRNITTFPSVLHFLSIKWQNPSGQNQSGPSGRKSVKMAYMLPRTPPGCNGYMRKSILSLLHQNLTRTKFWRT